MENPFFRIAAFFRQAMQPKDSVIGIDIGSAYLKVVQLRRKSGRAVLETYGSVALGPYGGTDIGRATHLSPEKLAEALRDVMREAHVTTANAALAIPFSSSLVTTIHVPALPERELPAAVSLEARKYIPVPVSEVALDWWIVPEEQRAGAEPQAAGESGAESAPEGSAALSAPSESAREGGMLTILIAAVHNEAKSRFSEVAQRAGLASSFFEIELFSAMRALFPEDLNAHAVLDLGASETKLYVIDRGLLRLSHIVSRGAQDLTLALSSALNLSVSEAEVLKRRVGLAGGEAGPEVAGSLRGMLDLVFSETNQALQNFTHRFGRAASDIILSGGGAHLAGIAEHARGICTVPVLLADPFAHVDAPAFLTEVLQRAGPEFSVAIGLALRKLQETP